MDSDLIFSWIPPNKSLYKLCTTKEQTNGLTEANWCVEKSGILSLIFRSRIERLSQSKFEKWLGYGLSFTRTSKPQLCTHASAISHFQKPFGWKRGHGEWRLHIEPHHSGRTVAAELGGSCWCHRTVPCHLQVSSFRCTFPASGQQFSDIEFNTNQLRRPTHVKGIFNSTFGIQQGDETSAKITLDRTLK